MKKYIITEDLNLVELKEPNYKLLFWIFATLSLVLAFNVVYLLHLPQKVKHITMTHLIEKPFTDVKLNDSGITAELRHNNVILANVACAQSKIESNHGKSEVGKKAKNLFGITYHKCKHVSGKYGVYASYNTYKDCIKCYAHIQSKYLKNIEGRYASDPSYVQTLKSLD
jgi:uncharacterized FlgJ-related protein